MMNKKKFLELVKPSSEREIAQREWRKNHRDEIRVYNEILLIILTKKQKLLT